MDIHYRMRGGNALCGDVRISGSKNAALPLIASSIICDGETVLRNVPRIRDTESMLCILEYLGAETHFEENGTVRIRPQSFGQQPYPKKFFSKFWSIFFLAGPKKKKMHEASKQV